MESTTKKKRVALKFMSLENLLEYARFYSGGDKAFKDKTQSEKAYTNIAHMCTQGASSPDALKQIKSYLGGANVTNSATREKIYHRIAAAIEI